MLISPAYAQAGGGMGGFEPLIPLILIFVVFYFLLIRPQQKKAKAHREMIGDLRRGDHIVTAGGLIGQITKVQSDNELVVEIADNVRVRVARAMVADLVSRPDPAKAGRGRERDEDEQPDASPSGGHKPRRRRNRAAGNANAARTANRPSGGTVPASGGGDAVPASGGGNGGPPPDGGNGGAPPDAPDADSPTGAGDAPKPS